MVKKADSRVKEVMEWISLLLVLVFALGDGVVALKAKMAQGVAEQEVLMEAGELDKAQARNDELAVELADSQMKEHRDRKDIEAVQKAFVLCDAYCGVKR